MDRRASKAEVMSDYSTHNREAVMVLTLIPV